MADSVELVSDVELERLAKAQGSFSVEARVVEDLRELRAKDRQVFAFRVGASSWFTGATPDAKTKRWLLDLANRDED